MPIADINTRDRFLIVGSFLRKDHPLLASRVRQAVKKGAQANIVHAADDALLMPVANKAVVAPSDLVNMLAQILKALATEKNAAKSVALSAEAQQAVAAVQPSEQARAIARSLASGERAAVLLGNYAQQHPQAAQISQLAEQIAALCAAKFGYMGEAANSVGGYLAGAVPFWSAGVPPASSAPGMNAAQMLASPRKAYILLNVEPELDVHDPQLAMIAMRSADMVVAMSAYKHHASEYADVLLPIAPFTETSGTFVNTEGCVQSFRGAVKPLGEARPAWKVLRVLGNLLDVSSFDYDSSEAVRDEVLGDGNVVEKLNNSLNGVEVPGLGTEQTPAPHSVPSPESSALAGLQRIADVPIYSADAVVRRAVALQATQDAVTPSVIMQSGELQKRGIKSGDTVKVTQGNASVHLIVRADDSLPAATARVAAGHPATAALGAMFGMITVESVSGERA